MTKSAPMKAVRPAAKKIALQSILLSLLLLAGAHAHAQQGAEVPRWWTRIDGAGFYDTRWEGWFLQAYAQRGYDLLPDGLLSAYGIAWISADSRSESSGPAPTIISDNLFIAGAGLRFKPAGFFWIDARDGLAFDLVERQGKSSPRNDFRLVATAGTGIYPPFLVHDHLSSPLSLMTDFFISSGYYSRYTNYITYAQARVGLRVAEVSRAFADVYLRGDAAFDSDGEFYNNVFEFGPGVRITPDASSGLFLMVEYHRGRYADFTTGMRNAREAFYGPFYDSVRFLLVFSRDF